MADNERMVDFTRIEEISGGDREFEVNLFNLFIKECEKGIMALNTALEQNNIEEAKRQTHSMRGACANIGAQPLGEALNDVEQAIEDSDPERVTKGMEIVEDYYKRTAELLSKEEL
ncbi:MAG: Hpt domain-containing protein [Candidatus Sumerlaeia bacterium]|nr:Hpt domain-containing protein [Candidatus Sumerlaeia bacterium]